MKGVTTRRLRKSPFQCRVALAPMAALLVAGCQSYSAKVEEFRQFCESHAGISVLDTEIWRRYVSLLYSDFRKRGLREDQVSLTPVGPFSYHASSESLDQRKVHSGSIYQDTIRLSIGKKNFAVIASAYMKLAQFDGPAHFKCTVHFPEIYQRQIAAAV